MFKEKFARRTLIWFYTIRGWWRYVRLYRHPISNGVWYYSRALKTRFYHNDGFRFTKVSQYDCGMGVEYISQEPMVLDYYKIGLFDIR